MKNASEKSKSFLIGLCIGVLLAGAIFAGWQRHCGRKDLIQYTAMRAKELSVTVKAALLFNDRADAVAVLNSLNLNPSIVFGGVYDEEGNLFASYYSIDTNPKSIKSTENLELGVHFGDGYLKVSEPVFYRDEAVGNVCIWVEP